MRKKSIREDVAIKVLEVGGSMTLIRGRKITLINGGEGLGCIWWRSDSKQTKKRRGRRSGANHTWKKKKMNEVLHEMTDNESNLSD